MAVEKGCVTVCNSPLELSCVCGECGDPPFARLAAAHAFTWQHCAGAFVLASPSGALPPLLTTHLNTPVPRPSSCQVLHCGRQLPITITLATIVSHTFPKEYEERRQEEREAGSAAGTSQSAPDAPAHTFQLPLFGGCGHECLSGVWTLQRASPVALHLSQGDMIKELWWCWGQGTGGVLGSRDEVCKVGALLYLLTSTF